MISSAPTASAARLAPSTTRCGRWGIRIRALALGARRPALGPVPHDDGRAACPFGQGAPLATDRETGAAPAEQTARLEARDEIEVIVSARRGTEPREGRGGA